jgi:hypothetical protein
VCVINTSVICWLLVEKAWRLILRVSVCPLYS